ncbi:MAG TPA: hypothetical protein VGB18_00845 [Candidatus Thermoplasmatota archaeon]
MMAATRAMFGATVLVLASGCLQPAPELPRLPTTEDIWWHQRGVTCTWTEWEAWGERRGYRYDGDRAVVQTGDPPYQLNGRQAHLMRIHHEFHGVRAVDVVAYVGNHGIQAACRVPGFWHYWMRTSDTVTDPGPNWTHQPGPVTWVGFSTPCGRTPWDRWAAQTGRENHSAVDWYEPDPVREHLLREYFTARGANVYDVSATRELYGIETPYVTACSDIVRVDPTINLRGLGMVPISVEWNPRE